MNNSINLISQSSKFSEAKTETEYKAVMEQIDLYVLKATSCGGFESLTTEEGNEFHRLALLAEAYEDSIPIMPLPVPPQNASEYSGTKMHEKRLKQRSVETAKP